MSQSGLTSMTLSIEIFKAGRHTAMSGEATSFSQADLDGIVAAYDPTVHEAPIVLGHPKDNAPAYGWIKSLSRAGDLLRAEPHQLQVAFVEGVKSGAYKKKSASFYRPDSPNNPKPGTWYLRHVGFLGAQPPAVKGLADVAFSGGADDCVDVELDFGEFDTAMLLRSLRDWILGKFGQEDADKALPPWDVNNAQVSALLDAQQGDPMAQPSFADQQPPAAGAQPPADQQPAAKQPSFDALWTVMAALLPSDMADADKEAAKKKLEAAFKGEDPAAAPPPVPANHAEATRKLNEREANLRKREREAATREHTSFLEGLVSQGKPLPETRGALLGLMSVLSGDDVAEVSFGENDKRTPLDIFRSVLSHVRAEIDFGERAAGFDAADADGDADTDAATQLHRDAIAFQEAEASRGIHIQIDEAVRHVQKGKSK